MKKKLFWMPMAGDIVFKFRKRVKPLYNIISVLTCVC